jgi:GT2 family glycosyltransferase
VEGGTDPLVSFVIPVRDDAERLRRCLASIHRCRRPTDRLEIVVADNGSVDGSDQVARAVGATVLSLPGLRVSALRNRAAREAAGELLAFVDADHEVGPGWLAAAVSALQEKNVGAAGSPYHVPADSTWVQRLYDGLRSRHPDRHDVDWLGTGNLAIRKTAFERIGGFDERLETCEDVDLCRRLRAAGFRLIDEPRMFSVHHGDPATLPEVFLSELWRGRDNFRVSIRRPISWRTLASMAISLAILGAIPLALAGLGLAFFTPGRPAAVVLALALAIPAAIVVLRAWTILRRRPDAAPGDTVRALALALAYDLGRALAPVLKISHRWRRRPRSR